MDRRRTWPAFALIVAWTIATAAVPAFGDGPGPRRRVEFNRDVRPILSENCFACHGPDRGHRQAGLRLDTRDGFVDGAGDLLDRVASDDPDDRMPPPGSGKALAPAQVATLRAWVDQGAEYQGHWSYLPPIRPTIPPPSPGDDPRFAAHPVDRLIMARLRESGLRPSPEADRATLLRRLSFDLTGLPPTVDEVRAFLGDRRPDAYERQVDRLLASPRYGERMAQGWLDLVRFADTIGYNSDNPRDIWPYRDYVIRAFNDNKPFDRFTVEQLAGDLLPGSTVEQKVASGYNRLLQTTEEGGAQPAEYEAKYAADRVRNVSTVWLGATMGCCQCHDHKFDPFTARDFYGLAAFFADVREVAVGAQGPGMPVPGPSEAAELAELDRVLAGSRARTVSRPSTAAMSAVDRRRPRVAEWSTLAPTSAHVLGTSTLRVGPDGVVRSQGPAAAVEAYVVSTRPRPGRIGGFRLEVLGAAGLPAGGPGLAPNGNFVLTEFKAFARGPSPDAPPRALTFRRAAADFEQVGHPVARAIDGQDGTGWAILPAVGVAHEAVFELEKPVEVDAGGLDLNIVLEFRSPYPGHQVGKFRLSATADPRAAENYTPPDVRDALATAPSSRTGVQRKLLAAYRKAELVGSLPRSLVTTAGEPRTTRVLARGNWQDQSGEVVGPRVPPFLGRVDAPGRRPDRLDLARWVVDPGHPLTARVAVNRLWKVAFGQGLARTLDDLGSQGEWPTHPELLDWLAVDFVETGWDVKRLVRLLVTSSTYRQSSLVPPELKERDPANRLYARQSRYRLDAEEVRDNALTVAGLLSPRVGGPSVKPYQPSGYWDALNFPPRTWQASTGEDQHRRGLYTHWQRSYLHPSLQAFDAPTREECTADRARSNVPQQALALLNDPSYVEAAHAFAARIVAEGGPEPEARAAWAFEAATSRRPTAREVAVLLALLADQAGPDTRVAWVPVARALLNLHETITRD